MPATDRAVPQDVERLLLSPLKEDRRRGILEVLHRQIKPGISTLERIAVSDRENDLRILAYKAAKLMREQFLERPTPIADPSAEDPVVDLSDPTPSRRQHAVVALGKRACPELLPRLVSLALGESDPMVKASLAKSMAHCTDLGHREQVLGLLSRSFLRDPDPRVRMGALEALGIMDGREVAGKVLYSLSDEDLSCRALAVEIVKKWGLETLLTAARSMLLESQVKARKSAIDALALFPKPEVVGLLSWALSDPSPALVERASNALLKMAENGQPAAIDVVNQYRSRGKPVSSEAPSSSSPVPSIEDPLESAAPLYRLQEIRRITQSRDLKRVPDLVSRLSRERDDFVISALINAFGQLGTATALDAIKPFLTAFDNRVRANAVESIGRLGSTEDRIRLVRFFKDRSNRVKANAVIATFGMPGVDVKPVLVEMLSSDDVWMRKSALYAIHTLNDSELMRLLNPSEMPRHGRGLPGSDTRPKEK